MCMTRILMSNILMTPYMSGADDTLRATAARDARPQGASGSIRTRDRDLTFRRQVLRLAR